MKPGSEKLKNQVWCKVNFQAELWKLIAKRSTNKKKQNERKRRQKNQPQNTSEKYISYGVFNEIELPIEVVLQSDLLWSNYNGHTISCWCDSMSNIYEEDIQNWVKVEIIKTFVIRTIFYFSASCCSLVVHWKWHWKFNFIFCFCTLTHVEQLTTDSAPFMKI